MSEAPDDTYVEETPEGEPDTPLQFRRKAERDTTGDLIPFQLGDDDTVLFARRPKMRVLMELTQGMDDGGDVAVVAAYTNFVDRVLIPESREYVQARFDDDDDDFDVDDLDEPMQYFLEKWYGRPTSRRSGSAGSPPRTGPRSMVRRRS